LEPIHKSFTHNHLFPFHLVYKDTKLPQDEMPDHVHDWFELVYVYRGKGVFFIDHKFYDMESGDLFFIPGSSIHRAFPDSLDPITSSALFFSPTLIQNRVTADPFSLLSCFQQAKDKKQFKFQGSGAAKDLIVASIEMFKQELDNPLKGSLIKIYHSLHLLLLQLSRESAYAPHSITNDSSLAPQWLKDILRYIDQHPKEDLRLSRLSQQFAVSAAHLSRVFKQNTAMNITDYVVAKRIILAKEYMSTTNDSISEIACDCGFESLPYFHKKFKHHTGQTPLAFRRLHNFHSSSS
jgi:AraC-like DNA-binding protein